MTDRKKSEDAGAPPSTVGAIGVTSPKMFVRTLVPQPLPATEQGPSTLDTAPEKPIEPLAGPVAAPAREKTIDVSASDADVILESNSPPTQTTLTLDARKVAANEPTNPGVLQKRLKRRKSIALAVATGLGVVALGLAVRGFAHRTTATSSAPPSVSATTVPAESLSPPAPAPLSAPDAVATTADSVTPPPKDQPPAASAPAKNPTPKARPSRPKRGPSKVTR